MRKRGLEDAADSEIHSLPRRIWMRLSSSSSFFLLFLLPRTYTHKALPYKKSTKHLFSPFPFLQFQVRETETGADPISVLLSNKKGSAIVWHITKQGFFLFYFCAGNGSTKKSPTDRPRGLFHFLAAKNNFRRLCNSRTEGGPNLLDFRPRDCISFRFFCGENNLSAKSEGKLDLRNPMLSVPKGFFSSMSCHAQLRRKLFFLEPFPLIAETKKGQNTKSPFLFFPRSRISLPFNFCVLDFFLLC